MSERKSHGNAAARKRKLKEAIEILEALRYARKQSNELAAYVLLAMLDLGPTEVWSAAKSPLRGVTPIIGFIYDISNPPTFSKFFLTSSLHFCSNEARHKQEQIRWTC